MADVPITLNIEAGSVVMDGDTRIETPEIITPRGMVTYYAKTSDVVIPGHVYLTEDSKINKLTQSNLTAANIKKGVTVKVNNGSTDVFSVTGTADTYKKVSECYTISTSKKSFPIQDGASVSAYYITVTLKSANIVYFNGKGLTSIGGEYWRMYASEQTAGANFDIDIVKESDIIGEFEAGFTTRAVRKSGLTYYIPVGNTSAVAGQDCDIEYAYVG